MKTKFARVLVILLFASHSAWAKYTLIQGDNSWDITPVTVPSQTAVNYYSYGSPHNVSGNNPNFEHLASKLYLFEDPDGTVSLVMHHSNRNKSDNSWIKVHFGFEGIPDGATASLSDDKGEFRLNRAVEGKWKFKKNSDGGVLGNLSTTTQWCMTITPDFFVNRALSINDWDYLDGQNSPIDLQLNAPVQICHTIPAPGALLLASIGTTAVGWLRRRRG